MKSEREKLRKKNISELEKDILKAKESLRALRFDLESGKVKNSAAVRNTRKEIAVLRTIVNEKVRAEQINKNTEENDGK